MANRRRGEIEAELDGKSFRMCLTLGALAELEAAFGAEDMMALATRFESGRISARDCQRILGCGLRGAGYEISDVEVAGMQAVGGAAGYVAIVARLLEATFGAGEATPGVKGGNPRASERDGRVTQGPVRADPFPGTT